MDEEIPPQYKDPVVYDFRNAIIETRGYKAKRKRDIEELEDQAEQDAAAFAMSEPVAPPPLKKTKHNTVGTGKASNRPWKEAGQRAGSLRNPLLSTSWESKMKAKADKARFNERRREALAAHKQQLADKRKRQEDGKKRREENRRKSAVVQRITSHATLRRMMKSKKDRKKLMTSDFEKV
ncbi:hypothetical protein WJX73_004543 [Symbiochloris irregularis]|uniref:Coiled-coil domain-containing protein 86 n=1 Tax=Symbiochloris irregularis TaxID=706552 RepID=A0AAW1NX56_9CHLO